MRDARKQVFYSYVWSNDAKLMYYNDTCAKLHILLNMFKAGCIDSCVDHNCKDVKHMETIDVAYESLIEALRSSSSSFYIRKKINNIVVKS